MSLILSNSKARRDYNILETLEAGLVLRGTEVKSLRAGRGQIRDAFARVENGEAFLCNAHIEEYDFGNRQNHQPKAIRKLLLHKKEILRLGELLNSKGTAVVPLSFHWKGRRVKVLLGVGKGKAEFDKREDIRKREVERELRRVTQHGLKRR